MNRLKRKQTNQVKKGIKGGRWGNDFHGRTPLICYISSLTSDLLFYCFLITMFFSLSLQLCQLGGWARHLHFYKRSNKQWKGASSINTLIPIQRFHKLCIELCFCREIQFRTWNPFPTSREREALPIACQRHYGRADIKWSGALLGKFVLKSSVIFMLYLVCFILQVCCQGKEVDEEPAVDGRTWGVDGW